MLAEMAAPAAAMSTCRDSTSRIDRPQADGSVRPTRDDVPPQIEPAVVADLDAFPPPRAPVVPYVECVQDRIASRSCAAARASAASARAPTIKRPLRFRKVETIVQAALEQYRSTGYNEISLLSLSTSDYPALRRADAAAARDVSPAGREPFRCPACGSTSNCGRSAT